MDLQKLKEEFPKSAVSWRAQTLTKNGDKALALAYIDARDVMIRLDDVCGPENWQDRYEVHGGKTICYISIRIDDENRNVNDLWVTKADGAGDTAVEAEKGSISDAFKRAAVKWGIGRYLYDLDAVWVPCETYERNGKKQWSKWKGDPWNFVRESAPAPKQEEKPVINADTVYEDSLALIRTSKTLKDLQLAWIGIKQDALSSDEMQVITHEKDKRKSELSTPSANLDAVESGAIQ